MSKQIYFVLGGPPYHISERGDTRVVMDHMCGRCGADHVTVAGFDSTGCNEYSFRDLCANCIRDILSLIEHIEAL